MSSDLEESDASTDADQSSDGSDAAVAGPDAADPPDTDVLRGRIELLEEENRRLRTEYARAKRSQYRRTGAAIGLVGILAAIAGVLYPTAQQVLFALGGTGIFLGILVFYLTPETVISADIGERVYDAIADNETAVAGELGLSDRRLVVPGIPGDPDTKLYVPQRETGPAPDPDDLTETLVVAGDNRGLALRPTGHALYEAFERTRAGDPAADPSSIAEGVSDALVEQFELVETVETDLSPDADEETGRVSVGVGGSAFGVVDRFDHPVPSFVAVAVATELDTPVDVETERSADNRLDALVTCRWGELDADAEATADPDTTADTEATGATEATADADGTAVAEANDDAEAEN